MKEHRRRPVRGMPFRRGSSSRKPGGWKATLRALVVLVVLMCVIGSAIAYSVVSGGLSADDQPGRVEQMLARAMRRWATPQATRQRANPVAPTERVLDQALEHYADHCATCHGNGGSGDTAIGRGLYPPAPDMRAATTQSLTDGELFSIIEHGIRLTGMPAWGNRTSDSERDSWALVHFVRRLPNLSDADVARMEALNPKTPSALQEEEKARRFLEGDADPSPNTSNQEHQH